MNIPEITEAEFENIVDRLAIEERWDELKMLICCGEGAAARNEEK